MLNVGKQMCADPVPSQMAHYARGRCRARPDWKSGHCCPPMMTINPLPPLDFTSIKDDFILLTQSVFILSWGKFDHNSLTLITETPCDPEKPVWPTKSPDMRFPSLLYPTASRVSSPLPSLHSFPLFLSTFLPPLVPPSLPPSLFTSVSPCPLLAPSFILSLVLSLLDIYSRDCISRAIVLLLKYAPSQHWKELYYW